MKDYQREELRVQAERAKKYLEGEYAILEDEAIVAAWEYIQELESDRRRLEFLAETGWCVFKTENGFRVCNIGTTLFFQQKSDWRNAIDQAMEENE